MITDEQVEAAAQVVCKWIGHAWDGEREQDISDRFPDWSFDGLNHRHMSGGKPALRRVAQAALEAAERAAWQPIETAPKDRHVLLWGAQTDPPEDSGVRYVGRLVFSGYWDRIDESWCTTGSSWAGPFFTPTHWRPLPPPPEGE